MDPFMGMPQENLFFCGIPILYIYEVGNAV